MFKFDSDKTKLAFLGMILIFLIVISIITGISYVTTKEYEYNLKMTEQGYIQVKDERSNYGKLWVKP